MSKITSVSIVSASIGFCFLLENMIVLSSSQAQERRQASTGNRLLSFPSDASVGVLLVGRLKGARALARNPNLERVQLSGKLTRAAVMEFAKLPKLTSIYINSSELDAVDCVDLQFEFPSVARFKFKQIGP